MKILYITPYFSFRQGGASEIVYQLATHLTDRGHEVTLLTSDYLAEDESNIQTNFEIVRLPSLSRWGFYVTLGMISWLKKNLSKFDIVHLQEFRTFQNIVASYFATNTTIPFFLTAHGTVPNIIERQIFKKIFDLLFQKRILRSITAFTAVSPEEVRDYKKIGIETSQIHLIYNGLNLNDYDLSNSKNEIQINNELLQLPTILFLGRLHKKKRIDVLINAFKILNSKNPNSRLIIAGPDNGEEANLRQQVKNLGLVDKVDFFGPVYGEKKTAVYRSASMLGYPSSHEVFGLVPFEALLCGTPVIVTENTGMGDIIKEAQAGITVPQDDPKALADAIAWVLDNPELANQQVKKGQQFIRENLDWSKIAVDYERLYQQLIDA